MNAAVNFYDKSGGVAIEVHNKPINNLLAAKVKTFQTIAAQMLPKDLLLVRHFAAKFFGALNFIALNFLTDDDVTSWHGL